MTTVDSRSTPGADGIVDLGRLEIHRKKIKNPEREQGMYEGKEECSGRGPVAEEMRRRHGASTSSGTLVGDKSA